MLFGVTIDSATTEDMDDGLFAEFDGEYVRLFIAIANVADKIKANTEVDKVAKERCFTRYNRGKTVSQPMLPQKVANGMCSLVPCEPRPTLVLELVVSPHGEIAGSNLRLDEFTSIAKVAYDEVPQALDGSHSAKELIAEPMRAIHAATTRLFGARKARGAVAFVDSATGLLSTEDGLLENVREEEVVGYVMVQEAMITANIVLAKHATEQNIPILYRNHEARIATPPRTDVLAQLEQASLLPSPHLASFIERVDVLLNRARYDVSVRGHYGLCASFYTHATSPIRRYADLVTQRQIVASLRGEPLPHSRKELDAIAKHINGTAEQSDTVRREHVASAISMAQARSTRRGYRALKEGDLERVVRELSTSKATPTPEFVEDVVRRIETKQLPPKATTLLLPMIGSSAVWEHAAKAICEWFAASPHEATTIMQVSKSAGSWSASVARVESNPDLLQTKLRSICAASLVAGGVIVHGPRCAAPGQQMAWHRAVAAVVIQHLGGEVPREWIANNASSQITRDVTTEPNRVPYLIGVLRERNLPDPKFSFGQDGPMHKPTFQCTCVVGDVMAEGNGDSKQHAKNEAAHAMLMALNGNGGGKVEEAVA